MLETASFPPPRQRGLVIHGIVMAALLAICVLSFWRVFQTEVSTAFSLYILFGVISFIPLPFRLACLRLLRSDYLNRNTLRIIWGLRVEDVPYRRRMVALARPPASRSASPRPPPGAVLDDGDARAGR
jgi:hypothetical protein